MPSGSKIFSAHRGLRDLIERRFDWERWERLIAERGVTIDRPRGSNHPDFPSIVYPIDYGYVNGTLATDGHEIDLFVGKAKAGLVGTMIATDHRKGDTEFKLIYDCRPEQIYLINGFINFDRTLMDGILALRWPMDEIGRRARRT